MRRTGLARTSTALVGLILIAVLAMVAPVDSPVGVDLHGGEALHPIFPHAHPSAPAADDTIAAAPLGQPAIQGAHAAAAGSFALGGEALPITPVAAHPDQRVEFLARSVDAHLSEIGDSPLDPPPEPV